MKDLDSYINEKLNVNNIKMLNHKQLDESKLDKKIESIQHFLEMLNDYFDDIRIKTDDDETIDNKPIMMYDPRNKLRFIVHEHFFIKFKNGNKLFVGNAGEGYYLQLFKKINPYKFELCKVVGIHNILTNDTNFKEYLYDMKKRYKDHKADQDINLLVEFGIIK